MELNLHSIATKSFVSGHEFQEHDRVVSYLVRPPASTEAAGRRGDESAPAFARYDLLASEDQPAFARGDFSLPGSADIKASAFVYCRWLVEYKPRKVGDNGQALKLTAENLFLTLAIPAGSLSSTEIESGLSVNTPLLQFLALMLERKKQIKPVGKTEDGLRQIYEHRGTHQRYEVPIGDLNVEFFQKIQEHLGVLVGTPKKKEAAATLPTEPAQTEAAPAAP